MHTWRSVAGIPNSSRCAWRVHCGIVSIDEWGKSQRKYRKEGEVVYGHVMRREEHYVGRRDMVMKVQGRRKRGRPERRWLDKVEDDIKENGLSADGVYDRATWRRMLTPHKSGNKMKEEKKKKNE